MKLSILVPLYNEEEAVATLLERVIAAPLPAGPRIRQLASEAAAQDHPESAGKFAIVAPSSLAFGLGREYQTYRELDLRSKKQVGVFRTLAEALSFLGIETLEGPEPRRIPPWT